MGLDMYLYLQKYESKSKWREEETGNFYPEELNKLSSMIYERNFLSRDTSYQVAYWRKANAIHKWFVDNCANGVDECQKIWVDVNDLKKLIDTCKKTLENQGNESKLLPTCQGFFFGSQKYDENYKEDLKYTINVLEEVIKILKQDSSYDCYYRASW